MLFQYTHIKDLSADQKARLEKHVRSMTLEDSKVVQFEGNIFLNQELKELKTSQKSSILKG